MYKEDVIRNMKTNLPQGKKGELDFESLMGGLVTKLDGTGSDFVYDDGVKRIKLELKSDQYKKDTSNFFMEIYSVYEKKLIGGPRQAQHKGSGVFIYWYPEMDLKFDAAHNMYIFDVNELVNAMERVGPTCPTALVANRDEYGKYLYSSQGHITNREKLADVYTILKYR